MSRGHRALGKRRWDETMRKVVMAEACEKIPWQTITDNRALRGDLEFKLLDRVLRQTRAHREERMHVGR